LYLFSVFCLGFGLFFASLSPAFAAAALDPGGQTVNINGLHVNPPLGHAFGNSTDGGHSDNAESNNNTLNINSGGRVTGDAYGAYVYDSGAAAVSAIGNSVFISGGTVIGDTYGGHAFSDSGTATATGNTIYISGGSVGLNVVGGWSDPGDATYNTVTISGSPTFGATTLAGGTSTGDAFTGNTLNVWNYSGTSVAGVQNFQYYNFLLPASLKGLEVTGTVNFAGPGGATSTVTGVTMMGGGRAPQIGESISLIHAGAFTGTIANNGAVLAGKKGALLDFSFRLDQQANDLFAVVEGAQASPQAKALSEGFISGVALTNQGADLVAGKGISDAVGAGKRVAQTGAASGYGFGSFAAVSGSWSRYNTGSHIDMSSLNLIAGLSFGGDLPPGRLTVGAFFEYGSGSYNTYNSFSHTPDVKGDGNSYYLGGGILGRMDFIDTGPGNFYVEASGRMGGVHNEYNTNGLRDAMSNSARGYDTFSPYYGIHAGLGYIWKFTEKASLDLHAKYFWTRMQGADVTLATGDPVSFRDVDSHRLRFGGRFAYAINNYVAPYIGAAWEYEMDGRQRATTYGNYDIKTPTLYGSTGIGELGLTLKPSITMPLSFDLGVQGYVGKREGVTGSLQVRYEF